MKCLNLFDILVEYATKILFHCFGNMSTRNSTEMFASALVWL